jgi:hypothetical protein
MSTFMALLILAKTCQPTELEYYHKRCQIIYQRSDYCVTYYKLRQNPDGSKHIDILCGVQRVPQQQKGT